MIEDVKPERDWILYAAIFLGSTLGTFIGVYVTHAIGLGCK